MQESHDRRESPASPHRVMYSAVRTQTDTSTAAITALYIENITLLMCTLYSVYVNNIHYKVYSDKEDMASRKNAKGKGNI